MSSFDLPAESLKVALLWVREFWMQNAHMRGFLSFIPKKKKLRMMCTEEAPKVILADIAIFIIRGFHAEGQKDDSRMKSSGIRY